MPNVAAVYAAFSALSLLAQERFAGSLGGRLVLYAQLDVRGGAISLAGSIAGAASLGIDADEDRLTLAIRNGACDFFVNSLDEALRILKNEIRKKQPVSVGLLGDVDSILREIVERGLQPDVLAGLAPSGHTDVLLERGAVAFDSGWVDDGRVDVTWSAAEAPALWLPKVDAIAAEGLPPDDERLRWLKFAPRYLGRRVAGRRYMKMSPVEAECFADTVRQRMVSGALGAKIVVIR